MATAKTYETWEHDKPFRDNGKWYVMAVNPKDNKERKVRWYTETQRATMDKKPKTEAQKDEYRKRYPAVMGFTNGQIWVASGKTYENLEFFRNSEARYNTLFGWHFIGDAKLPELPEGIMLHKVLWNEVCSGEYTLKDDEVIRSYIAKLTMVSSNSNYQGEIGDRLSLELTVTKTLDIANRFGQSRIHNMEDANGNVYIWITQSKQWEVGDIKVLKGTVKEHKEYRGVYQTVLTRCIEVKNNG